MIIVVIFILSLLIGLKEGGIQKCNEFGEFVFEFYYGANTEIPNEAEIEEIIKIIRSD